MIHKDEARCTEETALKLKENNTHPAEWTSSVSATLGIPVFVSKDVPAGKLQFWADGRMIKEIDV